jgi:hypothetical protein
MYNENFNFCYVPVSCPSGSSFNSTIGQCTTSFNCPSGSSYDSTNKTCITDWYCPNGTQYNNSTKQCESPPSCPPEYHYDNSTQQCVNNQNNQDSISPCPENTIFDSISSLCVGDPLCHLSDFMFDDDLEICSLAPQCPYDSFLFSPIFEVCIATPNCPTGFQLNTSGGICITNSTDPCPSGYIFDGSGKCVITISCPGEGTWDKTFKKCVQNSICLKNFSDDNSNYCEAIPSCSNGGVLDENIGRCVIETACSKNVSWVEVPQQSFYLKKGEESYDCEYVCKIKITEPKTGLYIKSTSAPSGVEYGTKGDNIGLAIGDSYYYKPCVEEATNQWRCPVEDGEQIIDNCKCINNFGQAAGVIQAIRQAGQDIICSSGKLY